MSTDSDHNSHWLLSTLPETLRKTVPISKVHNTVRSIASQLGFGLNDECPAMRLREAVERLDNTLWSLASRGIIIQPDPVVTQCVRDLVLHKIRITDSSSLYRCRDLLLRISEGLAIGALVPEKYIPLIQNTICDLVNQTERQIVRRESSFRNGVRIVSSGNLPARRRPAI